MRQRREQLERRAKQHRLATANRLEAIPAAISPAHISTSLRRRIYALLAAAR